MVQGESPVSKPPFVSGFMPSALVVVQAGAVLVVEVGVWDVVVEVVTAEVELLIGVELVVKVEFTLAVVLVTTVELVTGVVLFTGAEVVT